MILIYKIGYNQWHRHLLSDSDPYKEFDLSIGLPMIEMDDGLVH